MPTSALLSLLSLDDMRCQLSTEIYIGTGLLNKKLEYVKPCYLGHIESSEINLAELMSLTLENFSKILIKFLGKFLFKFSFKFENFWASKFCARH